MNSTKTFKMSNKKERREGERQNGGETKMNFIRVDRMWMWMKIKQEKNGHSEEQGLLENFSDFYALFRFVLLTFYCAFSSLVLLFLILLCSPVQSAINETSAAHSAVFNLIHPSSHLCSFSFCWFFLTVNCRPLHSDVNVEMLKIAPFVLRRGERWAMGYGR